MTYSDAALTTLTNPAVPLFPGNRAYDVAVAGDGDVVRFYEVQAPNLREARTIARERSARIYSDARPTILSARRSEVFTGEGWGR